MSEPVIPSQKAAEEQFGDWLKQSRMSTLVDLDDQVWNLIYEVRPYSDSLWQGSVRAGLTASTSQYIKAQVLDQQMDSRFIGLLGEKPPTVYFSPDPILGPGEDAVLVGLRERVLEMDSFFKEKESRSIKRKLLGKWLDQQKEFGHGLYSGTAK